MKSADESQKLDALAARRARIERELRLLKKLSTSPDSPITEAESRRRKELALARLREIELAERESKLIPVAQVLDAWAGIGGRLRDALLAIPDKVAPTVAAALGAPQKAREVREVLRHEVEAVLRLLAQDLDGPAGLPGAALDTRGDDTQQIASATPGAAEKPAASTGKRHRNRRKGSESQAQPRKSKAVPKAKRPGRNQTRKPSE